MGRDTRDRILAAAAQLFDERGFDGTSIADLLERAGVNSGSLYHFFPSKEAVAAAVVERCAERVREDLLVVVEADSSDSVERVLALIELRRSAMEGGDPARIDPVGLLAAELAARAPEVGRLAARSAERIVARIRDWLDAAGPRLPAETDRDGLARFVLTVLEGASMRARAERSLAAFDGAATQLRVLFALLEEAARRGVAAPAAPVGGEGGDPTQSVRGSGDPAGWRAW
jgi:TetR/AcrR family transcriptional repressor of nem operon